MSGDLQDKPASLGIPSSAMLAMRIASAAARPAQWADRIAARTEPLIAVGFGARMMRRFDVTHSPGIWADALANRFVARPSQSSGAELPLAPGTQLQRQLGQARWSGPSWPASTPTLGASPVVASGSQVASPLLGDLADLGWTPTAALDAAPVSTPPATQGPSALPVARRSASPPTPPQQQRASRMSAPEPAPAGVMPPTPAPAHAAPPAGLSDSGDAADPPTAPVAQRASASPPPNLGAAMDATAADGPATPISIGGATASAPEPSVAAPIDRSADAQPSAEPQLQRKPTKRAQSASAPPTTTPAALDLPVMRTAATRPAGLVRRQPPNPLERMGLLPPEPIGLRSQTRRVADAPPNTRPLLQAAASPLASSTPRIDSPRLSSGQVQARSPQTTGQLVSRSSGESAPQPVASETASGFAAAAVGNSDLPLAEGFNQPVARAEDSSLAEGLNQPVARAEDSRVGGVPNDAPGEPAAASAPKIDADTPSGGAPVVAASPAAPEIARSADLAALSSQAAAQPSAPAPRVSPLQLTTLILQRHSALGQATTPSDLLFLRTSAAQPASSAAPPALMRRASADAGPAGAASDFVGMTHPAPALRQPDVGTPRRAATIARSAIYAPALASTPTQPASAAQLDVPSVGLTAPASVAASGEDQADWGSLPIAQRAAERFTAPGLVHRAVAPAGSVLRAPLLRATLGQREGSLAAQIVARSAGQPAAVAAAQPVFRRAEPALPPMASATPEAYGMGGESPAVWPATTSSHPGDLDLELAAPGAGQPTQASAALPTLGHLSRAYELATSEPAASGQLSRAYDVAGPPALDLVQTQRTEIQRATAENQPAPTTPAPGEASSPAAGTGAQAGPNIEELAQKVYDHLRRRLLIDQERRGRSF